MTRPASLSAADPGHEGAHGPHKVACAKEHKQYDKAVATPLVFLKDGTETEKQCMERVKKAIKNSRSTNPLKK